MVDPKVGDRVVINDSAEDYYSITKPGSTGKIIKVGSGMSYPGCEVYVEFDKVTGQGGYPSCKFWIKIEYIKLGFKEEDEHGNLW